MASHRTERVGALLRQAVARMLLREIKDPRLKGVTITQVMMSADLRHARIFYRVASPGAEPGMAEQGFERAAAYIQGAIGRGLGLRYTPELHFVFDAGIDRARRLEALLSPESGEAPETTLDPAESHGRHPSRR